ncbi:UDP-N-acetylmuramoyl-L-alanyl-D-glutamate--2,6-diaminopimelate ligase [Nocardioides sp. R-C-SC26]|uniref:UDP-N-acetylmuramoyl-L-alanyl-D-glutamate--2, 6-diaminopimelate ligase n=1 Tax=Nocardioides sp. R-C-SC26 TaxID=2870414 RepID=UPI001E55B1C0|nr:UDP-N-acetylmuramoyl-L-alanyl-D-glutamate--2,6-diaminopimelate ligase [Nocardioides sp. R-C-SC26]
MTSRPSSPTPTPLAALTDVLAGLGETSRRVGGDTAASHEATLTGVSLSSQRVRPGDLYAALPGARTHGIRFAGAAVAAGAVAVLTDEEGAASAECPTSVPVVVVERPRTVLGAVSAAIYGNPARRLRTIGVTGTQGKTTTTRLLEGAMAGAGLSAAVIGTVGTRIAGRDVVSSLTTPEAPDLHGLLAVMVEEGVEVCAMEVSSHALVMGRVDGVRFDVAVFLNLGRDHLDFHADEEEYFAAKAALFTAERADRALVCTDDEHGRRLAGGVRIPVVTFALDDPAADWRADDIELGRERSTFTLHAPPGRLAAPISCAVPLPGRFNVTNALAAIAAAGEAGLDVAAVAAALGTSAGVPGRLERVDAGGDFLTVVDYAHKPDAAQAPTAALRPLAAAPSGAPGRVIVVIGAGGDRDSGKRPIMGAIAARLADVVIVTDDNPRSEEPAAIRAAVLGGAREAAGGADPGGIAELLEVSDRREAIATAIGIARAGDVVLIAGKGHETGQEIDGVVHPFDDRVVAHEALTALGSSAGGAR